MLLSWLLITIVPEDLNGSELSRPPGAESSLTTWGRGQLDHLGQRLQGLEKLMVKF